MWKNQLIFRLVYIVVAKSCCKKVMQNYVTTLVHSGWLDEIEFEFEFEFGCWNSSYYPVQIYRSRTRVYCIWFNVFFPLVQCPHWHEITSRAMLDHFEPGNHQRTTTISIDVNKNHQSLNHVRAHISESGHCDSVTWTQFNHMTKWDGHFLIILIKRTRAFCSRSTKSSVLKTQKRITPCAMNLTPFYQEEKCSQFILKLL